MTDPAGMDRLEEQTRSMLNRLAKWRTVFAGWQLGTRAKNDPESNAVRDHREATMVLRTELTALTRLMMEKGLFTREEWLRTVGDEAGHLMTAYERQFPGFRADDYGMVIDTEVAQHTTKGWRP